MPLAELGAFSRRQAKLLAWRLPASLYYSAHGIALLEQYTTRITANKKAPLFRVGLFY